MIITLGMVIGAVAVTGFIGRKGWRAFHSAVGITPGKLTYIEPKPAGLLPLPQLMQLELSDKQQQGLPDVLINQLRRIDKKADIYQEWQNDIISSGQTPPASEDTFVIKKLLKTRLPEALDNYQRISHHELSLKEAETPISISTSQMNHNLNDNFSNNQLKALTIIEGLMSEIENKLDTQLNNCQNQSLQELQVMQRYLDERK